MYLFNNRTADSERERSRDKERERETESDRASEREGDREKVPEKEREREREREQESTIEENKTGEEGFYFFPSNAHRPNETAAILLPLSHFDEPSEGFGGSQEKLRGLSHILMFPLKTLRPLCDTSDMASVSNKCLVTAMHSAPCLFSCLLFDAVAV